MDIVTAETNISGRAGGAPGALSRPNPAATEVKQSKTALKHRFLSNSEVTGQFDLCGFSPEHKCSGTRNTCVQNAKVHSFRRKEGPVSHLQPPQHITTSRAGPPIIHHETATSELRDSRKRLPTPDRKHADRAGPQGLIRRNIEEKPLYKT